MNWTAGLKTVAMAALGGLMLQGYMPLAHAADEPPGKLMIRESGEDLVGCEFDFVTGLAAVPFWCVGKNKRVFHVQIANGHSATRMSFALRYNNTCSGVRVMYWKTIKNPTNVRDPVNVWEVYDKGVDGEVIAPGIMLTSRPSDAPEPGDGGFHCIRITRSDVPADVDDKTTVYPALVARRVSFAPKSPVTQQDIPEIPDLPEEREHGVLLIRNREGMANCSIVMKTGTYNFKDMSGCSNDDAYGFMMQQGWSATTLTFTDTPSCAPTGDQNFRIVIKTIKHKTGVLSFYRFNNFYSVQEGNTAVPGILLVQKYRRNLDPVQGKLSCVKIERSPIPIDPKAQP